MKVCEACGVTEETTSVWFAKKYGKVLCQKHYFQMQRHGKILKRTMYDPNIIRKENGYAYIELYKRSGERIADAKINIELVDICSKYKWYLTTNGYVFGGIKDSYDKKVYLHKLVYDYFNKEILESFVVDHIDRSKLNNTIENLRIVTVMENGQNMGKAYKTVGVSYSKVNGRYKWRARITVEGKEITLGSYDTEEEAIKVRKAAEAKYFFVDEKPSLKEMLNSPNFHK